MLCITGRHFQYKNLTMLQIRYSVLAATFCTLTLVGPLQAKNTESLNYPTKPVSVPVIYNADPAVKLSLEQIMADPDWLGRQPEEAHWSLDSQQVYFERKRAGSELRDWYSRPLTDTGNGSLVPLSQLHQIGSAQISFNADRSMQAYVFEGDVFVRRATDGDLTQLTRDTAVQNSAEFLLDGRLVYREGWSWYAHDLATGQRIELVSLKTEDKPKAPAQPSGYLAQEQHKLIEFVALQQKHAEQRFDAKMQLQQQNDSIAAPAIYLGKGQQIVGASLSPKADYLVVSVRKAGKANEKDIMPNYITGNGDIAAQKVRARVNDVTPEPQRILLISLQDGNSAELSFSSLPGYNEDVLA